MKYHLKKHLPQRPDSCIDLGGFTQEEILENSFVLPPSCIRPVKWFFAQDIKDGSMEIVNNDSPYEFHLVITTESGHSRRTERK